MVSAIAQLFVPKWRLAHSSMIHYMVNESAIHYGICQSVFYIIAKILSLLSKLGSFYDEGTLQYLFSLYKIVFEVYCLYTVLHLSHCPHLRIGVACASVTVLI